ncbi:hypothetical protein [Sphingobacterium sp. UBA6308]|uniref:hypothetical protein n=1 Tax=Sphingobacterium TaxID=28453 RepID=UPI00257D43BF|nr:hypothetical protein [Sphingobacterium sp. UBA6308]
MKKATNRIVIVSENVNRYGFRALVKGVDLTQYEKNPILLWMHNRAVGGKENVFLPLGNVIDLRIEEIDGIGLCITGLPVFDDTDEFAMKIFNKFENGTIRMASAGLIPIEWSDDADLVAHGQRAATLIRSWLEEVSIVDIGADNNALSIALYDTNHNRIELSSSSENAVIPLLNLNNTDMSKIELSAAKAAQILGGKEVQTADQFETEILGVVQLAASQKVQIETLTREKSELSTKVTELENVQLSAKVENLVQTAVDARKITADEKASFIALAKVDYASVEKILGVKQPAPTIQSQLETNVSVKLGAYANKTWDQLDKEGLLIKLKSEDINLFKQLYSQKFNTEYAG